MKPNRLPGIIHFMRVPRDNSRRLLGFAKRMRGEAPDAEKKMWSILRSRKMGSNLDDKFPLADTLSISIA